MIQRMKLFYLRKNRKQINTLFNCDTINLLVVGVVMDELENVG